MQGKATTMIFLAPQQLAQLKAWFAVGLNPQINEILYKKGLGPQKH
jgi:hypothetical protein